MNEGDLEGSYTTESVATDLMLGWDDITRNQIFSYEDLSRFLQLFSRTTQLLTEEILKINPKLQYEDAYIMAAGLLEVVLAPKLVDKNSNEITIEELLESENYNFLDSSVKKLLKTVRLYRTK